MPSISKYLVICFMSSTLSSTSSWSLQHDLLKYLFFIRSSLFPYSFPFSIDSLVLRGFMIFKVAHTTTHDTSRWNGELCKDHRRCIFLSFTLLSCCCSFFLVSPFVENRKINFIQMVHWAFSVFCCRRSEKFSLFLIVEVFRSISISTLSFRAT